MSTVTHFAFPVVRRHSRRAFTLIELLAVIAIIGVLAAIILATLGNVRAKARQTQCLSNLRQLQLANILYANDNKGRFMRVKNTDGTGKWHDTSTFLRYLGDSKSSGSKLPLSMRCPDREDPAQTDSDHTAYGYNFTGLGPEAQAQGISQTEIPRPSQTLAFADAVDYQVNKTNSDKYTGAAKTTQAVAYRHGGRINIAYWDGHVNSRQRSEVANNSTLWDSLK
ncbi:N-terminal cleavage protein [Opitutaceae bacterium TAV5]|nr:N-terminal cleavage protein [Opitutaceae bacterium TAV5]